MICPATELRSVSKIVLVFEAREQLIIFDPVAERFEHGDVNGILRREMAIDRRLRDAALIGQLLDRHTVKPVAAEGFSGEIKNLLFAINHCFHGFL